MTRNDKERKDPASSNNTLLHITMRTFLNDFFMIFDYWFILVAKQIGL